jgi:nucleoprotein TPR
LTKIGHLSETAAAASRIQHAGLSLTEMYTEYARVQQELLQERSEVARLNGCLEKIVEEFELKAPMIQKTAEQYEKARQQIDVLNGKLVELTNLKNQVEKDASILKAEFKAKDNEIELLKKELVDRNRQVQALLREQFQLKGGHISAAPQIQDDVGPGASGVISQRLVVFHSIEELQSQNQMLLRSLRELTQKMEEQELQYQEQIEQEIATKVEESSEIINKLMEELHTEQLKTESYKKEKESWQKIAQNRSAHHENEIQTVEIPDFDLKYKDLESEFEIYKRECGIDIEKLKSNLSEKEEIISNLNIQISKLQNELSWLQGKQSEFANSTSLRQKEFDLLNERCNMMMQQNIAWENKVQECMKILMDTKEQKALLEGENGGLKAEKVVWKQSEDRLVQDLINIKSEREKIELRNRELTHMLKTNEQKYEQKKQAMEDELEMVKRDLLVTRKQLSDLIEDKRVLENRREMESEQSKLSVSQLEKQCAELKLKLQELGGAKTKVEQFIATLGSGKPAGDDQQHNLDSSAIDAERKRLMEELDLAKTQIETYKAMSTSSEGRLIELMKTMEEAEKESEAKISRLEKLIDLEKQHSSNLQKQLDSLAQALKETQEKMDLELETYRNAQDNWSRESERLKQSEEQSQKFLNAARGEMELISKKFEELQNNYEREVMAHSSALTSLRELKGQLSELRAEKDEANNKAAMTDNQIRKLKESWRDIEAKLNSEITDMQKRVSDLVEQNKLLHVQLEQIGGYEGGGKDESKVISDLREVIKYLRRENEIMNTKVVVMEQEGQRLQLELQALQTTLEQCRVELENVPFILIQEKTKHISSYGQSEHQELLQKIEHTNLLRESNITLRTQAEMSAKSLKDLETKYAELQAQFEPLKGNHY